MRLKGRLRPETVSWLRRPPMNFDAWDIDIYYQEKGYEVEDLKEVSVEKSSLMTTVKMTWNYEDSVISQEIRLYNDDRGSIL